MKKLTTKTVSIILTIVMVTSLITLPAFAAVPVYRDPLCNQGPANGRQHREWMAPYGEELSHFDYCATDADGGTVTYSFHPAVEYESVSVDPDGVACVNYKFADRTISQPLYIKASSDNGATNAPSGNLQYVEGSPFIHNFDTDPHCFSDGILYNTEEGTGALFQNVTSATDPESGNTYMVAADSSKNSMEYRAHRMSSGTNAGIMNSHIISFDVKLSATEVFNLQFAYGVDWRKDLFLTWDPATGTITDADGKTITAVEPGWHSVKLMLYGNVKAADNPNPYRSENQRYALFFDDDLLTPTRNTNRLYNTYNSSKRPNYLIKFEGSEGIDNFKHYGSSTPHAYGVALAEAPQSGAIISATASMHSIENFTNDKTHFEYYYYISDTKDKNGEYTLVTSKDVTEPVYITTQGKLAINTDLSGHYIKVGARVWNRGGRSPEVMSKEAYEISGFADGSGLGEATPDVNPDEEEKQLEPYVIFNAANVSSDLVGTYYGKTAYKWGPGEAELKAGVSTSFNAAKDKYKYLVLEMYSAKKTHHPMNVMFYKSPSATYKGYYGHSFSVNWEGEWKTIKIPISGGLSDRGNCGARQSPNWKPYEASTISLNANLNEGRFYNDTELYISKAYFEGNGLSQTVANEKGEIILPDCYDPDTMVDYVSLLKEKSPNKKHPRLIVTDEKIEELKENIETNEFLKKVFDKLKDKADTTYVGHEPEPPYTVSGTKVTMERNYFENTAKLCGLMYLLTGEDKYAEQVWKEAANMIGSDVLWSNESTGLDAAHIANGMALTYDWCYDYLTDAQRLAIRNALMRHTYASYSNIRNGGGYLGYRNNVVAANSKGFMTSLLAICDEPGYENFCNEFINHIIKYLPENIGHQYVPDGNYAEGIGYWSYATYSTMFLSDAMLTSMGTDGGIQNMPGLEKTGYFPFAMRGATSLFNFSDAGKNVHQNMSPVYHYLAKRYDIPALRAYRIHLVNKHFDSTGPSIEDLLWFDPSLPLEDDWRSLMPKDYFLDGLVPLVSLRHGTSDSDERYIAAKGGNGIVGHKQYDAGSYVLDAFGRRWIHDMGAEVYDRQRLDEDGKKNDKYYYSIRAEGHNCIVFDPQSEAMGQIIPKNEFDGYCPIVDSGANETAAFATIDLQPSYREYVDEYKRSYAMVNGRSQFIVQDKFSRKEAGELYSFLHISAGNVVLASDGSSLILRGAHTLDAVKIDFITDIEDFKIGVMDAIHLLPSLRPEEGETRVEYTGHDTSDFKKIYFYADNVKDATISVVFTPLEKDKTIILPEVKPMENWNEYLSDDFTVDHSDVLIYEIDGNKVKVISNQQYPEKKKIILAAYKDNALVAVKSTTQYIVRNVNKYELAGFDPKEYDEIKAFVWDDMTTTLKPLAPSEK